MKKNFLLITILLLSVNSAFSYSMSGGISQDYDMSFEAVLRKKFGEIIEVSKVFEKNDDIYYQKRFKPVYMLSIHELYSMLPSVKSNIEKRRIPNTYNLSLKGTDSLSENNIAFHNNSMNNDIVNLENLEKTQGFEKTNEKYKNLITKNPDRIELLYKYAQFLYSNNKYDDATAELNNIIEKDKSFVLASYTLGNIYFDKGDYKNAIKANLMVIKHNPYCADAYFNIASALEKMRKFSLAIDYYQKCLSLNAGDSQAQNAIRRLEQLSLK